MFQMWTSSSSCCRASTRCSSPSSTTSNDSRRAEKFRWPIQFCVSQSHEHESYKLQVLDWTGQLKYRRTAVVIATKCVSLDRFWLGLPDFSLYMIPKPKNVPNEHKSNQWSWNIPNLRKIFQLGTKYYNIFQSKAFKFTQRRIFGMKINHLATLVPGLEAVQIESAQRSREADLMSP
jgi:hypothetical protein